MSPLLFCAVLSLALISLVHTAPTASTKEQFQFSPMVGFWQPRKLPLRTGSAKSYKGRRISWIPNSWNGSPGKRSSGEVTEGDGPAAQMMFEEDITSLCSLLEHLFAEMDDVSQEVQDLRQVCGDFGGNADGKQAS